MYGYKGAPNTAVARRRPNDIPEKPSLQINKGKLPIDFNQHFFFYNGLFFITEVFKFIWECSQVTGNKMELKKNPNSNYVRIS